MNMIMGERNEDEEMKQSNEQDNDQDQDLIHKYRLIKIDIIYNNNEVMATGFGNTRKQAERNASIIGYKWLLENKISNAPMTDIE